MSNLLEETLQDVKYSGHNINDVRYVGSIIKDFKTDWNTFTTYANFEYDATFGRQNITCDLVVVFSDGSWLERIDDDGCESWGYRQPPKNTSTSGLENVSGLLLNYN